MRRTPAIATPPNTEWIALAAGLAGVILTIIAGFIGAMIQGRREHNKWIRDQRLRAYTDHLAATDNYLRAAQHDKDNSEYSTVTNKAMRAMSTVQLVGPESVAVSAASFQASTKEVAKRVNLLPRDPSLDRLDEERLANRRAFIAAARKQTKVRG